MSETEKSAYSAQVPFFVCPKCFHTMSYAQVHDQAKDDCPKCGEGMMKQIAIPNIKAPASGVQLLCLVCAFYKPWGIFDSTTGVSVCVECRDKARAQKSQSTPDPAGAYAPMPDYAIEMTLLW